MTQRPKTPREIANELLRKTNPRQQLSELGKDRPGLDDEITDEQDVFRPQEERKCQ
jgi:hypothetical protein